MDIDNKSTKPRRAWLAAVLSLLGGPLGQVYVGRLRRSLCFWLISASFFPLLAFCLISVPIPLNWHIGFMLFLLFIIFLFPIIFAVDAFLLAKRNRHTSLKKYQRWWVYIIFLLVFKFADIAVVLFNRSFIAEAFVVPGRSMSPTILPEDRILVDKLWFNLKHFDRNEVVVYRSDGPESPKYIQRIVGLPGDEIEIKNERVFVNGEAWDDRHAVFKGLIPQLSGFSNFGPITVPSEHIFVLGDNRRMSMDSRMTGSVPISDIHGKAVLIYWSRERTFLDPLDTKLYILGPILWDRMGMRLD